jgi:peptide/nickel transport system substrate-binding protein
VADGTSRTVPNPCVPTPRSCAASAPRLASLRGCAASAPRLASLRGCAALTLLSATLLGSGCGDSGSGAGNGVDSARRGGTAVIAGYVEIRGLSPFTSITDLNKALERYALFMPLVMLDSALTPVPWLAESWDTVPAGADSLLLSFRLRRDVFWQDGTPTTALDVATTFRLAMDPRSAYVESAALELYHREPEVVDSFTVRFRLRRHPDFLEAFFLLPPLPAHVLAGVEPQALARHPFGTQPLTNGPFRFVRGSSREWVFDANPDFPQALGGRPRLDRLVYRTIPEQTSLITEVLMERVDLALSIRPPQVSQLAASEAVRVITFPVPNWIFIALNTELPLFRERDVRRAIAMAVDRQALVDGIMGGHNVTGRASVTPVHWAYDAERAVRFDPDSARLLLDRAGWTDRDGDGVRRNADGLPFRFRLKVWQGAGSYRDMAEAVQAQLARVGIVAQPEVVEFNTFLAQLQGRETPRGRVRDFEAAIGNWTDNLLRKDDSQLLHSRNRGSPRQWTGFNSPDIDALLDTIAITMDRDEARPLWSAYQQALLDESPLLFLFYAQGINAARRRLEGIPENDPRGPLATVQRWWLRQPQPAAGS